MFNCDFYSAGKHIEIISTTNSVKPRKTTQYVQNYCSDKKYTVVNRALLSLHERSLESILTYPLV